MKGNKPVTQEDKYCTYMRYLKCSNSLKQNGEWWLPGWRAGGKGELLFNGYEVLVVQDG